MEQKVKEINKIKNDRWLDEYKEDILKGMTLCHKCLKYSEEKNNILLQDEIRRMKTCDDFEGKGDYDLYGDVKCSVKYHICPICGNKNELEVFGYRILAEYDSKGRRVR